MTPTVSSSRATGPSAPSFSAEKRRVALLSMAAAAVMTVLKLGAGLLSGSLGVLSDAAHSGLDLAGSSTSATSRPTKTIPTATAKLKTCRRLPSQA